MAAKRIVREVQASTLVTGAAAGAASGSANSGPMTSKTAADKLELAKRLASRINLSRQMSSTTPGTAPTVPDTSSSFGVSALAVRFSLFLLAFFFLANLG